MNSQINSLQSAIDRLTKEKLETIFLLEQIKGTILESKKVTAFGSTLYGIKGHYSFDAKDCSFDDILEVFDIEPTLKIVDQWLYEIPASSFYTLKEQKEFKCDRESVQDIKLVEVVGVRELKQEIYAKHKITKDLYSISLGFMSLIIGANYNQNPEYKIPHLVENQNWSERSRAHKTRYFGRNGARDGNYSYGDYRIYYPMSTDIPTYK